jgi:hypothetical protein
MIGMKAQILTATLFTAFSGALSAADPQLLNLVMPDAKVLAGVNVEQAKGTQFGQYVLNQLQTQDAHMQQLVALTGFDPRRDVRELLVASDGVPGGKTGLALAKGNFDPDKITAFAIVQGVVTESYNGFKILEEPKSAGRDGLPGRHHRGGRRYRQRQGRHRPLEDTAIPARRSTGQAEPVEQLRRTPGASRPCRRPAWRRQAQQTRVPIP